MKKRKPDTRVVGVYKDSQRANGWRIVYQLDGVTKQARRTSEDAANAYAKELQALMNKGQHGAIIGKSEPVQGEDGDQIGDTPLTRAGWLRAIWLQMKRIEQICEPLIMVQGLDAMQKAYKVVRDDLAVMETGVGVDDDPTTASEDDLDAEILHLKRIADDRKSA